MNQPKDKAAEKRWRIRQYLLNVHHVGLNRRLTLEQLTGYQDAERILLNIGNQ